MNILVTGGIGFIGTHLCIRLLSNHHEVLIVDNFDPFYDVAIKKNNLSTLKEKSANVRFIGADINDGDLYNQLQQTTFDCIIHLAGKAGVRPSIANAAAYEQSNVSGTLKLLEFAKKQSIPRFISASSSSVYGVNPHFPWSESDSELMPISPYAATKLAAEHLGFTYSHLYDIHFTALRFFTVYGPGQRPDLAIHKFFKAIYSGLPIDMYGDGSSKRDYTYIDDIVSGIMGALSLSSEKKFDVFNLGGNHPISLKELLQAIEQITEKQFDIVERPMQPGDVPVTYADISKAESLLGYAVATPLESGLSKFKDWFKAYYNIQ